MKIQVRGRPADLKSALERMAPAAEQADLLALLTQTLPLLEPAGPYEMVVEVIQPDVMGSGITNWSASFRHAGTATGCEL